MRTGKVSGEKLTGLIKGLRADNLTRITEKACLEGTPWRLNSAC